MAFVLRSRRHGQTLIIAQMGLSQAIAYRRILTGRITILFVLLLRPFTFSVAVFAAIVTS
jgi:hypothetical protein